MFFFHVNLFFLSFFGKKIDILKSWYHTHYMYPVIHLGPYVLVSRPILTSDSKNFTKRSSKKIFFFEFFFENFFFEKKKFFSKIFFSKKKFFFEIFLSKKNFFFNFSNALLVKFLKSSIRIDQKPNEKQLT